MSPLRRAALAIVAVLACSAPPQAETTPGPAAASPAPAAPAAALPLFDAHIHYSEPAWSILSPDQALERLARSGVRRAIVSSSPDSGTIRLYERAPDVVVPFLRPYRGEVGPSTWARDGTTVAYVKAAYRPGVHRGIGEVHLSSGEADLPVVRQVVEFAVAERLWLQVHTDARGIDELMRGAASGTRVLWAHAGQSASPEEVGRLLDRYPTLWVELAGRSDVGSSSGLDPKWREAFLRHPARFMVGSDTWVNPQWERLPEIEAGIQAWLAHLPTDIARRIASGNAEALFPVAR